MKTLGIIAAILFAATSPTRVEPTLPFLPAATIQGIAAVRNGDGVLFGLVEIRLQGVAAPEDSDFKREPGGPESTTSLQAMIEGKKVTCYLDGTTASSNRPVGVCYLGTDDIGERQVRSSHVRDCPRYFSGRYAKTEAVARAEGKELRRIYSLSGYRKAG